MGGGVGGEGEWMETCGEKGGNLGTRAGGMGEKMGKADKGVKWGGEDGEDWNNWANPLLQHSVRYSFSRGFLHLQTSLSGPQQDSPKSP